MRDKLRKYFERRVGRDHAKAATHWEMSEWCEKQELWHLARVEAYAAIVRDPDHEAARAFVGHRQRRKGWLWPVGSRWMTQKSKSKTTA